MTFANLRAQASKFSGLIAVLAYFAFASTETRWNMVEMYAAMMAIIVGWYIIAKFRYLRWMAGAEQRAAEAQARTRAWLDEWYAPKPEQQTAAYFNWDGPYTVAGRPR